MEQNTTQEKPKVVILKTVLEILDVNRDKFYRVYKKRLKSIPDRNRPNRQLYNLDEVLAIKKEIEDNLPYVLVKNTEENVHNL